MRIAIMGSGGVGGYFGARLAKGGADVTFIARGAHLEAMRKNGLRIDSAQPLELPKVNATDDPSSIGKVDVILFSVKLWDTESAAKSLVSTIGPDTGLISFQNGVQKDDMLRPIVGEKALIGGTSYIAASIKAPGVIGHLGANQRLVFGEFDRKPSKRVEAFHAACIAGGITAEINPDINVEIWQKFVFLVGMSGATASMRANAGQIRTNPQTRQFMLDLMKEVVAVGLARGVALSPDYAEQRIAFIDTLPAEMVASMANDLRDGKQLELPWLSGGVVDLAASVNVPTPANRAVRDILALYVSGKTS